jgi:hypothetical protein
VRPERDGIEIRVEQGAPGKIVARRLEAEELRRLRLNPAWPRRLSSWLRRYAA